MHPTRTNQWRCAPALLGTLGALCGSVLLGLQGPLAPARAGLLGPLLQLMRPQIEGRLNQVCLQFAAGDNPELRQTLTVPCQQLAGPTSRCLVEEIDTSGRGLGVLSELMGGRFGDDSEVVVKRCLARLLGIPADSLQQVPLRDLARRLGSYPGVGLAP